MHGLKRYCVKTAIEQLDAGEKVCRYVYVENLSGS